MPQTTALHVLACQTSYEKFGPCTYIIEEFTRKEVTKTKGKYLINNKTTIPW